MKTKALMAAAVTSLPLSYLRGGLEAAVLAAAALLLLAIPARRAKRRRFLARILA